MAAKFIGLKSLHYHVWVAMLDLYQMYRPCRKNILQLKVALQSICNDLLQYPINRSMQFHQALIACIKANGEHFEYLV